MLWIINPGLGWEIIKMVKNGLTFATEISLIGLSVNFLCCLLGPSPIRLSYMGVATLSLGFVVKVELKHQTSIQ
jgi:hypothetical protein